MRRALKSLSRKWCERICAGWPELKCVVESVFRLAQRWVLSIGAKIHSPAGLCALTEFRFCFHLDRELRDVTYCEHPALGFTRYVHLASSVAAADASSRHGGSGPGPTTGR